MEWIWTAYIRLLSCRSVGMEYGPIPWTAVEEYKDRKGLDEEEGDLLEYCLLAIDDAISKWREDREKEKKRQAKRAQDARPNARKRPPRG